LNFIYVLDNIISLLGKMKNVVMFKGHSTECIFYFTSINLSMFRSFVCRYSYLFWLFRAKICISYSFFKILCCPRQTDRIIKQSL